MWAPPRPTQPTTATRMSSLAPCARRQAARLNAAAALPARNLRREILLIRGTPSRVVWDMGSPPYIYMTDGREKRGNLFGFVRRGFKGSKVQREGGREPRMNGEDFNRESREFSRIYANGFRGVGGEN